MHILVLFTDDKVLLNLHLDESVLKMLAHLIYVRISEGQLFLLFLHLQAQYNLLL